MDDFDDIKPEGLETPPNFEDFKKGHFKMFGIVNWKTSLLGFAILVAKFLESQSILPVGVGDFVITTLTGLLGLVAGDAKKQ